MTEPLATKEEWIAWACRMEAERDNLLATLKLVPAALNNAFLAGVEEMEGGSANRQERYMKPVHELREKIHALSKAGGVGAGGITRRETGT